MTSPWTFRYLLPSGVLSAGRIGFLLAEFGRAGFISRRDEDGGIVCVAGDGAGILHFESMRGAVQWLDDTDGLIALENEDGIEVSISFHRAHGILPVEIVGLPDSPQFDVCALDIDTFVLSDEYRDRSWSYIDSLIGVVASTLSPLFIYGMDEDALEVTRSLQCIHRRVSQGRMPPVLAWLTEVPVNSPLSVQLEAIAAVLNRPIVIRDKYISLRLTEKPWTSSLALLERAGELARNTTHDSGCWP
ncbi:hypothetical protein [Frankia sp. Cas3]|uniref:hypothetical protein n=1 Tax=Frankia sp. Cas3 TaxID=3073926 RepID=UPI002AD458CB|nr:hypothetical protein [Frankia sp. Cas3]